MKSTSLHAISADFALSRRQQRLWWCLNWINNRLFPWSCKDLDIQVFRPDTGGMVWAEAFGNKSPSRVLCDLFWATRDWNRLRKHVGDLDVLDLGCGSGRYGERIERWSGAPLSRYTGTDMVGQSSWNELRQRYPHFRFFQQPVSNVGQLLDENLSMVMSQSAIEHFPHDGVLMKTLAEWQRRRKTPVVHIHLLPARSGLEVYQYHGVRQYTPRTCRMLAVPFLGWTKPVLHSLGGPACTSLHAWWREHVSWKGDGRMPEYEARIKAAIAADIASASREASFYALTIE